MKVKPNDLRDRTLEELELSCQELQGELFHLRNDLRQSKKLEKPHKLRLVRKDIARHKTVMREKQNLQKTGE